LIINYIHYQYYQYVLYIISNSITFFFKKKKKLPRYSQLNGGGAKMGARNGIKSFLSANSHISAVISDSRRVQLGKNGGDLGKVYHDVFYRYHG
jgi:hypothetical protein